MIFINYRKGMIIVIIGVSMIGEILELVGAIIESSINIGQIIDAVIDIGSNKKENKNIQDDTRTMLSDVSEAGRNLQKESNYIGNKMDVKRPSQKSNLTYEQKINQIIEQVNRFKSNQNSYASLQRYTVLINKMLEIKANYVAQFNTQHDLYIMEQVIDAIYDDIFQYEI